MDRFYFDLFNDSLVLDDEGSECDDVAAARTHAEEAVRELAAESIKAHSHLVLHHHIVVRDEQHAQVAVVTFGDVVRVEQ